MPTLPRETGWLLIVAYGLGLVMLMTSGVYEGRLAEPCLVMVVVCGFILVALFTRIVSKPRRVDRDSARPPLALAAVALTVFVVAAFGDARLLLDSTRPLGLLHAIESAEIVLVASYVPAILRGEREGTWWLEIRFALLGCLVLVGGANVIARSPNPNADAWLAHSEGARALLRGVNPYAAGSDELRFVYPPTSLYASAASVLARQDVRWSMLIALLVAGVAMRMIAREGLRRGRAADQGVRPPLPGDRVVAEATTAKASPGAARAARSIGTPPSLPGLAEDAPALMLWLTPKAYLFLEQSWNDVIPLALLALSIWAHARKSGYGAAVLLGLSMSAAGSMIWLLPLAWLLRFTRGQWGVFLGAALLSMAPFVFWDGSALERALVELSSSLPERAAGLTVRSWLVHRFGIQSPEAPGVVLAAVTAAIAIWKAARSRRAFVVSLTLVVYAFYAFNRSTSLNDYFFLTGLVALAAAVVVGDAEEPLVGGAGATSPAE